MPLELETEASAIAGCTTSSGSMPAPTDAAAALGALRGAADGTKAGATKMAASRRRGRKDELRAISPDKGNLQAGLAWAQLLFLRPRPKHSKMPSWWLEAESCRCTRL